MLPTAAQNRLRDALPHSEQTLPEERGFPITWTKPAHGTPDREAVTTTVYPNVVWAYQDRDLSRGSYPLIALDLDPTTIHLRENRNLKEVVRRETVNDPTIAYQEYRGTDVYDVLNVFVAVATGQDGLPKTAISKELALATYAQLRFGTDYLESPGTHPYEWSMRVRPIDEGTRHIPDEIDNQPIDRYHMQFRVEYTLAWETFVSSVAALDYTVEINDVSGDRLTSFRDRVEFANTQSPDASTGG